MRIWIDCDTGTDDAAAILAADAEPALEIAGISAVAGNVPLAYTYRNTRYLKKLTGAAWPVFAGADKPLIRPQVTASHVHGENGLGDVELKEESGEDAYGEESAEKAWDALYRAACEDELTLVATAPLTNIAIAFKKYPDLPGRLKRVVLMGGAAVGGNVTSCAEFNIFCDPDAAKIVFSSGADIVMCGLDVTNQVFITREELDALAQAGGEKARFLRGMVEKPLSFAEEWGYPGFVIHDLCPVFYLAHPEWFSGLTCGVAVETKAPLAMGKTVTDLMSDKKFEDRNVLVLLTADREAIVRRFTELMTAAAAQ